MMRRHTLLYRLATTVSAAAMMVGLAAPVARAQAPAPPGAPTAAPPPPPGTAAPANGAPAADPPARVGRVSALSGTVSFHGPDSQTWTAASANYPVSNGDGFWTEPGGSLTIEVDPSHVLLSDSTELQVDTLDTKTFATTEAQGEIFVDLKGLQPGETTTVRTPRGTVTLSSAGQYDITAGDTEHPTVVAVVAGAADVSGSGLSLHVPAGQAATVSGTTSFSGSVGPLTRDAFLTAALTRFAAPPPAPAVAPPAVVAGMTGADDLDQAGTWRSSPDYGTIWYPRVAAGWRPYRDGHWAWVAPWGWTWIDDASWGFAPSHYGRWVEVDNAWAWAPAPYAPGGGVYAEVQPVYAPALVAFFGVGAVVGAAAAFGGFGNVGWVPLGPGEPFRPWYHHSDGYLRDVNVRYVTNIANINNIDERRVNIDGFRNRGAATVAAASAIAGGRRIGEAGHGLAPNQFAAARPIATGLDRRVGGAAEPRLRGPGPAIIGPHAASVPLRAPGVPHGEPGPAAFNRGPAPRPGEPARGPEPQRAPEPRPEAARPGVAPPLAGREQPRLAEPGRPAPQEARREPERAAPARPEAARPEVARRAPARPTPERVAQPRPAPARPAAPRVAARPAAPRPTVHVARAPARPAPARHVAAAPHGGGGAPRHRG
jgi:hypothetical protein